MIDWPDEWIIEHRKLTDYLLNINHRVGRAKARALLTAGFSLSDPMTLASALLQHARSTPRKIAAFHGTRFVFEGPLITPNRVISHFRSVWLMKSNERIARLVTAYPVDERKTVVIATLTSP